MKNAADSENPTKTAWSSGGWHVDAVQEYNARIVKEEMYIYDIESFGMSQHCTAPLGGALSFKDTAPPVLRTPVPCIFAERLHSMSGMLDIR